MNDDLGESTEPMEEVPLIGLDESEFVEMSAWLTERSPIYAGWRCCGGAYSDVDRFAGRSVQRLPRCLLLS